MNFNKETTMSKSVQTIIVECLQALNEELENPTLENITTQTKIFGGNGALDSLALVSFITDIEEHISNEFDKEIVLADEKAMSAKTSPFRTVESLTAYIESLLDA
jgi:acyl carrier protein